MEEKKLICINCPLGCALTVAMRGNEIESVEGNTCRRGEIYARKESDPDRDVYGTGVQRMRPYGLGEDEGGCS